MQRGIHKKIHETESEEAEGHVIMLYHTLENTQNFWLDRLEAQKATVHGHFIRYKVVISVVTVHWN